MKKQIITWGLMFAGALALSVSCAKEQDMIAPGDESLEPVGVPFELFAGVETKTSTNADASAFSWSEGDAINVFHAVAGSTEYGSNDEFTLTSGTNFSGTLTEPLTADAYDWYALYPYKSQIVSPANTSGGWVNICSSGKNVAQVQTGNNSKTHLAGQYFPLYGKAASVAKDTKPTIELKQALAVIRVHVTNGKAAPLTVENITFKAPTNTKLVGSYYIDFSGVTPVFTASNDSYVSNIAKLTVTGGTALEKDEEADFYFAVKPFTASIGDDLVLNVNGFEKTFTISGSAVEFKPGKIKTLNIIYNPAAESFSWDLSTNSYSAASASQVTWSHSKATMVADKYNASTATNNYLPTSQTSSRFYKNSKLTFTPADGFQITKVVVTATSEGYANSLQSSTWTNANAAANGTEITITPIDGTLAFYAVIGNTVGASFVTVYYKEYIPKTLTGIAVTTPPTKTDYKVGDALDMTGAVITASYDDSSSEDVTVSVTTDAETVLAHPGNAKPVTVTYLGKTATFNVNVAKGDAGISYATTSYSVAPNASFEKPSLTNPHGLTITYSSSDESLVLVDENNGDILIGSNEGGPVTITATAASNDDYNGGTASYTITITSTPVLQSLTIDFESESSSYTNWTFTNMVSKSSGSITAHGGTYYGTTGSKATASIVTTAKIASPQVLQFFVSKQSGNTTASSWKVQVSTDGSTWTDVKTQDATSMVKGEWVEVSQSLTSYSKVYVRVYYSGSTAVRNIDDLLLTYYN